MSQARCFRGKLGQLRKVVLNTRMEGKWQHMPTGYWRYRCHNGAFLNWWSSTGTINFQGPVAEAGRFRRAFARELARLKKIEVQREARMHGRNSSTGAG